MTKQTVVVHWFKQDLRLADNPGLTQACQLGPVLPIYIHSPQHRDATVLGDAGCCWLQKSLQQLSSTVDHALRVYQSDYQTVFEELIQNFDIKAVTWNRQYDHQSVTRDKHLKAWLTDQGIDVFTHQALVLWEPWTVKKNDQSLYRVFTPFFRKGCLSQDPPREPLPKPASVTWVKSSLEHSVEKFKPASTKSWADSMMGHWEVGESGAMMRLQSFLSAGIADYKESRNYPSLPAVSRLSPYLHFGEISPQQIWSAVKALPQNKNTDHFLSELGWREFSYYLIHHFPSFETDNWQEKFDALAWRQSPDDLKAWQKGQTGIPMVDAAMRELWQTGYMHNRCRMVVGSFLVKNCLIHWSEGKAWFDHCLLDADVANNAAGWQWIAGTGADAAPYFRIFNPVTQGQNFDKTGAYTRHYCPELKNCPDQYLFNPWEAPDSVLEKAGITLGVDYPRPIVDLKASRERALAAFQALKKLV